MAMVVDVAGALEERQFRVDARGARGVAVLAELGDDRLVSLADDEQALRDDDADDPEEDEDLDHQGRDH